MKFKKKHLNFFKKILLILILSLLSNSFLAYADLFSPTDIIDNDIKPTEKKIAYLTFDDGPSKIQN